MKGFEEQSIELHFKAFKAVQTLQSINYQLMKINSEELDENVFFAYTYKQ